MSTGPLIASTAAFWAGLSSARISIQLNYSIYTIRETKTLDFLLI
jgi:hypothetical protein